MTEPEVRLNKFLADSGLGSRRHCDQLIAEGLVEVDGVVVRSPGDRVIPGQSDVRVEGQRVKLQHKIYFLLNKPPGVICTNAANERKTRAIDLVETKLRLYTVGRLDEHSEGLILLTNDGWLAHRLTHPSYEIPKTYRVKARGRVPGSVVDKIRGGVHLAEGKTGKIELRIKRRGTQVTTMELVLREGMNREIRRVFARHGHTVFHLKRIGLGPLTLSKLPLGASRRLSPAEVRMLYECIEHKGRSEVKGGKKGARKPRKGRRKR